MGAFERKVGVAPAENVVEAATVASEDAPDAMSERGSAVGFVEISEKVSEGVERTLLVVTAAALDAAAVVDAAAADEVLEAAASATASLAWWWTLRMPWAETRAGSASAGRTASIMAELAEVKSVRIRDVRTRSVKRRRNVLETDE